MHQHRVLTPRLTSSSRKILWGSKILQDPPTVTYEEVMAKDEQGLFKWLSRVVRLSSQQRSAFLDSHMKRTNLAFVSFPAFPLHLKLRRSYHAGSGLFERLSVCVHTALSSGICADISLDGTFWDFTSDLAKGDTAYTTLALGAHTDTTYFVCTLGI